MARGRGHLHIKRIICYAISFSPYPGSTGKLFKIFKKVTSRRYEF